MVGVVVCVVVLLFGASRGFKWFPVVRVVFLLGLFGAFKGFLCLAVHDRAELVQENKKPIKI